MNLNFIELLANFQLITIENSSEWKQYQTKSNKKARKIQYFLYATLETSANNFVFGP